MSTRARNVTHQHRLSAPFIAIIVAGSGQKDISGNVNLHIMAQVFYFYIFGFSSCIRIAPLWRQSIDAMVGHSGRLAVRFLISFYSLRWGREGEVTLPVC